MRTLLYKNELGDAVGDSNPLPVEIRGYSFVNITTATTTNNIATGPGFIHSIIINKPLASGTITIYNNTSNSGAKVGTITMPGTLLSDGPKTVVYDVECSVGISIVTTEAQDITVSYL